MADGAILLAILHVLQGYAAHSSKSSRRQITLSLWLEVIKQSQIKQKQPGRQQQLGKRGGLGRPAEAHHLPTGHPPAPASALFFPWRPQPRASPQKKSQSES